MVTFSGQCLCGSVKFNAEDTPKFIANCHCKDCRQVTGSVYATLIFLEKDKVNIDGVLSTFEHEVDSGNRLTKHFCPQCGSQMFASGTGRPGLLAVRAGVIDESENIKPQINVFAGSALPSTPLDASLPAPERMP